MIYVYCFYCRTARAHATVVTIIIVIIIFEYFSSLRRRVDDDDDDYTRHDAFSRQRAPRPLPIYSRRAVRRARAVARSVRGTAAIIQFLSSRWRRAAAGGCVSAIIRAHRADDPARATIIIIIL